jgi:4-amino-4-deoxy-L-arabinose transferase-like glycosyltransferase
VQTAHHSPVNSDQPSPAYYLIGLAVLCGVAFFYGLGRLPFIGPDEPRYAEVARAMYVSGDWITPRLGDIHWFEKPALTYWLSVIGYQIFGLSEFGARFGVALVASFGALLLFFFGQRVHSARWGYLSAAVLITCGLWPGFARGATFDLPLAVAMELALLSFFLWSSKEAQTGKHRYWWVFCLALGLAVLAKGLIGIVLPLAIIAPYLLLTRQWRIVLQPRLLIGGALVFLATTAIWYAPMFWRHGREFIDEFFIAHHFQRYLSNKYRHPQPFYFFPVVALLGSFPWSFHFVASAWRAVQGWRTLGQDHLRLFLWLWAIVPILFFSFSGSKLPGYILPIFPAVALLVGGELERWWAVVKSTSLSLLIVLTAIFIIAAGVGTAIIGQRELGIAPRSAWLLAGVAIVVTLIYLGALVLRGGRTATLLLPFGLAALIIAAAHLVFPALGRRESLRDLSLVAINAALPGERLVFYVNHDQGVNFYATRLPLRDTRSELITLFSAHELGLLAQASGSQSLLVVTPKRWRESLATTAELQTEQLGEQNFGARCSPDCDWLLLRVRRKL